MVLLAAPAAFAAKPSKDAARPVEACPVLKVNISMLPTSDRLMLHPTLENRSRGTTASEALGEQVAEEGINIAVLWQNATGNALRGVTVRLEYQQAKTSAFKVMDRQFPEVRPGGKWVTFKLRGGEYQDTGHIAAWRISVLCAGQVLGRKQSVLWTGR